MRKFFAIIGHPVAHSLSPVFQQAAFDATRIDAAYLPFDIPPENLTAGLDALKVLGISGFNATLPHKEAILPYLSDLSTEARQIGAVNTIRSEGGRWSGYNTDGPGFLKATALFLERNRLSPPSHALVFGAGGSSKAVLWALARMGVTHLCLVNRTIERAILLSESVGGGAIPDRTAFSLDDPRWHEWLGRAPRPLLVNTLSLQAFKGSGSSFPPLESVDLRGTGAMIDLSYVSGRDSGNSTDGQTPFLTTGKKFAIPRQNGLGMLLWQGALAFELWTGGRAPVQEMERSLLDRTSQKDLWISF